MQNEVEKAGKPVFFKKRILPALGLPVWVLFCFLFASLAIGLVLSLFSQMNLLTMVESDPVVNSVIAALVYTLAIFIVIGIPFKLYGIRTTKEELGLTRLPNWTDIVLAPAAFVAYMVVAGILTLLVSQLFPGFNADEVQDVGFNNVTKYYEYVLAFITLVVFAPIAEEVLIRGYLYGKLRKIVPFVVAMLISSLLFSLMHFQWNVAVNVFPLAVILVLLREQTGSIWSGILLHMLKNGVAFYLLFINPSILNTIGG